MIKKPAIIRKWALCPWCKAKTVLYDNTANCNGVWLKCKRGCGREFELKIVEGDQDISNRGSGE